MKHYYLLIYLDNVWFPLVHWENWQPYNPTKDINASHRDLDHTRELNIELNTSYAFQVVESNIGTWNTKNPDPLWKTLPNPRE